MDSKMRVLLAGLMVALSFFSCSEKIPDDVIPSKQMPDVLIDVHLADGQMASIPTDSARVYRNAYYQAIFNRHRIDSAMLRRSIEFYSSRPYLMGEIYNIVEKKLEELNTAEQQVTEAQHRAQRLADSISNARRTDSLRRIVRDSLDLKRKRWLLFPYEQDSTYQAPDTVIYEALRQSMWEAVGLDRFPKGRPALTPQPAVPADSAANDEPVILPDITPKITPTVKPPIQR